MFLWRIDEAYPPIITKYPHLIHWLQEDLKKAILASIEDFDPENPWIVDASGRHTNVAALLDWPSDDSDDSDSMASDTRRQRNQNLPQEQGKTSGSVPIARK